MESVKRKSSEERRNEIIDAVLDLSAEGGPGNITTEALAGRVGLSHAGIFRHFPSKRDIWLAVFGELSGRMQKNWSDVGKSPHPPGKRLRTIIRMQLGLAAAVPALPAILFSRELHRDNEILRTGIEKIMKKFHALLSEEISAGIESGDIRPGLDADDAAYAIIAALQGTVLRWSISRGKFDLVHEGEKTLDIILRGFENIR